MALSGEGRSTVGIAAFTFRCMGLKSRRIAEAKLRTAFDLFDAGVDLMRQNLRGRHPEAAPREIEERLTAWLSERPGAEAGDAVGVSRPWPSRGVPHSKSRSPGSQAT